MPAASADLSYYKELHCVGVFREIALWKWIHLHDAYWDSFFIFLKLSTFRETFCVIQVFSSIKRSKLPAPAQETL